MAGAQHPSQSAVRCAALRFGFAGPGLCWAVSLQACPLHRGPVQALPEHESVPVHEVQVDVCILNCSHHKGCTLWGLSLEMSFKKTPAPCEEQSRTGKADNPSLHLFQGSGAPFFSCCFSNPAAQQLALVRVNLKDFILKLLLTYGFNLEKMGGFFLAVPLFKANNPTCDH